jgi:peptidoglycan/xylan/chitin deacetylase (PgdA/CDA1 family)
MIAVRALVLQLARSLGAFAAAKFITRKQLRILCYHGFSLGDEYQVAPGMFMRAATFDRRMAILRKRRIRVLPLDEAVRKFEAGQIRNGETVLTFDDGWASNLTIGLPILEKYNYPACVYVTTEHLAASTEVFNVVLSYLVRRSGRSSVTLVGVHPIMDGRYEILGKTDETIVALIIAAEKAFPIAERQTALRPIALALGMDLDHVLANGRFRLLEAAEIKELSNCGVDIQLHTHTHRLPDDRDSTAWEIEQNRGAVMRITGVMPRHFCYPSGEYTERHPQWLRQLGVVSGTTCDPGLNAPGGSVMLLKRFLDSDDFNDIAFEAEVCGLRELARRARHWIRTPFVRRAGRVS